MPCDRQVKQVINESTNSPNYVVKCFTDEIDLFMFFVLALLLWNQTCQTDVTQLLLSLFL